MRNQSVLFAALFTSALWLTSCSSGPTLNHGSATAIHTIHIASFQCADPVIGAAARNVFVENLTPYHDVQLVNDTNAEVTIEGTVSVSVGSTAVAGPGMSTTSASGYVTGITSVASRGANIIASGSAGQDLGKSKAPLPPETLARTAATKLLEQLNNRAK